ncbi:tryptophan 7-halogenase [Sphingomonas sp. KR1UV-12]|uniref:Tryptophan 7-halogenase n=1 Tax=Sphingomonas aurea TaxID=3063994 RepID=A0ABT9EKS6_9SPHN|nr:tryptophan halogenase family protein [Sphingomonas sp. KR1UV-12]MDP1027570.1 tryptophan 7-halogenase [Sphingomonas sp. KR1UV-12]
MADDISSPIRSVVIAGGGTAGWMAAAALARHFGKAGVAFTLVESSDIGTIGVGEATIPTIRRFIAALGLSEAEVMRETEATAKLGILFEGWDAPNGRFLHPFGMYGQDAGDIGFHHLWWRARQQGDATPIDAYSLGAQLARQGRMALPRTPAPTPLATYDWAFHLDAGRFAALLRRYAEASGVTRIDAQIATVERGDRGVAALHLHDGRRIAGDLFVDCTGFRSLLLGEAMAIGFEDWRQWLPCDAAIAVQSEAGSGDPPPYTRAIAHGAGWRWQIPLRHRAGNGIVYAEGTLSEDEATARLLADLPGKPLTEPRRIPFRSGRRTRAWAGNVVALGLAAGFLEPLESTSIALIETGIERLRRLFPAGSDMAALADEFNDATADEWERVRDFIILHYKLTGRRDTGFWRDCAAMDVPATLARKLALWDARGEFVRYRWEMFHPSSWLALYAGFDRRPAALDPALAALPAEQTAAAMARMRAGVAQAVAAAPGHADFLRSLDR